MLNNEYLSVRVVVVVIGGDVYDGFGHCLLTFWPIAAAELDVSTGFVVVKVRFAIFFLNFLLKVEFFLFGVAFRRFRIFRWLRLLFHLLCFGWLLSFWFFALDTLVEEQKKRKRRNLNALTLCHIIVGDIIMNIFFPIHLLATTCVVSYNIY